MRATWIGALVGVLLAGCASAPSKPEAEGGRRDAGARSSSLRFVDPSLGFEISRPDDSWQFEEGGEAPPGLAMPVVISHPRSGAQVVVQVAPDVAAPGDFADRLALGLQSKPGFATTEPQVDGAGKASFLFKLGDEVFGKVNVVNGADRLFVVLATWPADAPERVVRDIDGIMESLHTSQGTALMSCPPGQCVRL